MENNELLPCCDNHNDMFMKMVNEFVDPDLIASAKETGDAKPINLWSPTIAIYVDCNGKTFQYLLEASRVKISLCLI